MNEWILPKGILEMFQTLDILKNGSPLEHEDSLRERRSDL